MGSFISEKNNFRGKDWRKIFHRIDGKPEKIGFVSSRMKTGTPPRVDGRSLDFSKMEEQKGDENPGSSPF